MNYIISQLWAAFNLYLVNRGVISIPYPAIYITDPIIKRRFASFCSIFQSYPRILQSFFLYNEERYTRHPDLIPDNNLTRPLVENGIRVGVKNLRTNIERTTYKGKVCCWVMARRASKTTYINIRSVDLLQIPFGSGDYAQQIFHGTKDAADEFFDKLTTQLSIDKITNTKATSTDGKIKFNNNIIEFRYLTSKGGNRGHMPITVAVDEVGFITNQQLHLFMEAVDASMRDNKSNITFLTSPAESLENTYLTNLALNPDASVTFMLPAFFNNAKNRDGQMINSSLSLIATTQKLVKENKKFMVGTTIFGKPLLQGGREIFIRPHFYIFNKKSFDPNESDYAHLPHIKDLEPQEQERQKTLSDTRRYYGKPQEPNEPYKKIRYSFLVSDLSFSGIGDYTVIFHVGVATSGDIYILGIFRQPTVAANIERHLIDFLLDRLASPYGDTLRILYIEGKDSDASVRIRTLKQMVGEYNRTELEHLSQIGQTVINRKGYNIDLKTFRERISNVAFGAINPKGGVFNAMKPAGELLHGATQEEMLYLATSGSKLDRARTAASVLSRISPITQEPIKIVFFAEDTDDHVVEDVMNEILSKEAASLSNNKNKNQANAHDDAFDTLTYAILVCEKVNDAELRRGFDINNGFKILSAEKSMQSKKALMGAVNDYNKQYNSYRRSNPYRQSQKTLPKVILAPQRPA